MNPYLSDNRNVKLIKVQVSDQIYQAIVTVTAASLAFLRSRAEKGDSFTLDLSKSKSARVTECRVLLDP